MVHRVRGAALRPRRAVLLRRTRIGLGKPVLAGRIARWDYTFEPVDGGTRVTETWTDGRRGWPDWAAAAFDKAATGGRLFSDFQRRNIARDVGEPEGRPRGRCASLTRRYDASASEGWSSWSCSWAPGRSTWSGRASTSRSSRTCSRHLVLSSSSPGWPSSRARSACWSRLTRRTAGWASALLLVAIFPANVQMAYDAWRDWQANDASGLYLVGTLVRLPLQIPLIWWASGSPATDVRTR